MDTIKYAHAYSAKMFELLIGGTMMIFHQYVVVAADILEEFQAEIDELSHRGFMMYQPVKFMPKGEPYRYLAVMEIARAEEEE